MALCIDATRVSHIASHISDKMDRDGGDTWSAVQDWFPMDLQPQAQIYWQRINETDAESQLAQRAAFNALKMLAYPGYAHFFKEEICTPYQMTFSIEGERGNILVTGHWPRSALNETSAVQRPQCQNSPNMFTLAEIANQAIPNDTSDTSHRDTLPQIDRLVVLGDSLSDSEGRMYQRSLGLIPSNSQYYQGNFTNGFVWTNFISSPDFLNKPMVNFAEGGSVSAHYHWFDQVRWVVSSLDKQIEHYKDPSARDLVMVFLGANDYMTFHKKDVNKIIDNQSDNIERLLAQGVKNVVAFGMPDLSLTPYAQHLEHPEQRQELHDISLLHNRLLSGRIARLQAQYPDATLAFFNVSEAFAPVYACAKVLGYNVTEGLNQRGYVHPLGPSPAMVSNPRYLFNDNVHPTQEVHSILAMQVKQFIQQHFAPP